LWISANPMPQPLATRLPNQPTSQACFGRKCGGASQPLLQHFVFVELHTSILARNSIEDAEKLRKKNME
jgi:hypothetical protein